MNCFVEKHVRRNRRSICLFFVFQTCDIKAEGRKRFLTLKNVQLDQAGEVSYQALNAVTSAMLTVKGTNLSQIKHALFFVVCCKLLNLSASENGGREAVRKVKAVCFAFVNNCPIIRTSQKSKWALLTR